MIVPGAAESNVLAWAPNQAIGASPAHPEVLPTLAADLVLAAPSFLLFSHRDDSRRLTARVTDRIQEGR